ncbi:Replication_factor C [Hexamita inflata]|uniref:Subunit 1 n=1 Tax=Hexamita inflata TaxID=28002 RepID=A0AA86QDE7_9EUKA|nr:Replication factor C [Hexamita inflata]
MIETVLSIDGDEAPIEGFYHFKPVHKIVEKKLGPLDKMLKLKPATYEPTKQEEPIEPEQPVVVRAPTVILGAKPKQTAQIYDTAALELDIDPFTGKPIIQEPDDQTGLAFEQEETKTSPRQTKKIQEADHAKFRPRVVESALLNTIVGKSGQLLGMTDEEYKQYIEAMSGQPCYGFSQRAQLLVCGPNYNQKHKIDAKKLFQKILEEDEFYNYIVLQGTNQLEKLYELKKQQFPNIKKVNQIGQMMNRINWVHFDECLKPITLKDIDRMCYLDAEVVTKELKIQPLNVIKAAEKKPETERQINNQQQETQGTQMNNQTQQMNQTQQKTQEIIPQRPKPVQQAFTTSFHARHAPQTVFEIESPQTKQIQQCLKENKAMLISGPIGCGKSQIIKLILSESQFDVYSSSDTQTLMQMITSGSFTPTKQKCIIIEDIDSQDKIAEILKSLDKRGPNRVIFTTNDYYNQKLKTLKTKVADIKMQKADQKQIQTILMNVFRKEKTHNTYFQQVPIQNVTKIIDEISQKCMSDIRQGLFQLEFAINSSNQIQKIFSAPSPFDFCSQLLTGQSTEINADLYFSDPSLTHAFLVQNYLSKGGYKTGYALYITELLSLADVQQYKMYSMGDWNGARSAQIYETQLVGIAKQMVGNSQVVFPSQVLSLKAKDKITLQFENAELLGGYENTVGFELGLKILDASYYLGFDEEDIEMKGMSMNCADNFKQIVDEFGLKFCVGKKKTDLFKFVEGQKEFEQETKKKGRK